MVAGHFGLAAAVKARAPSTPLWALMLATQWLDVIFVPLFVSGVEKLESLPGTKPGAYGGAVIHADYTHSLVGAVVLSVLFGALLALRYGKTSGVILGGVSFSHWLLDVPMHHDDMPLLPGGGGGHIGLGLWSFPAASALLELALVVVGGALYWRAARGLAPGDPAVSRRATLCGAGVLASCLLTLGLNLLGM